MTIARATRLLLALAATLVVAWSFFDVGRRAAGCWRSTHARAVTLTVMHWGDRAEDAVVGQLVERYRRDNPQVQIVRINPGSSGDFRSKLKTMLAAGTPPDLFYLPPDAVQELATLKLVQPLDDFIARDVAANGAAA